MSYFRSSKIDPNRSCCRFYRRTRHVSPHASCVRVMSMKCDGKKKQTTTTPQRDYYIWRKLCFLLFLIFYISISRPINRCMERALALHNFKILSSLNQSAAPKSKHELIDSDFHWAALVPLAMLRKKARPIWCIAFQSSEKNRIK